IPTMDGLPVELVFSIIEQLDTAADEESLRALSLVCRSFLYASQRCLFCSLALHTDPSYRRRKFRPGFGLGRRYRLANTFTRAFSVFTTSPHLARHVRSLTIVVEPNVDETAVGGVLRLLCGIECLSIEGITRGDFPWKSTPTPMSPYWQAIRLPGLRSLRLSDTRGLPSALLTYATSTLSHVLVDNISIDDNPETNGVASFLATETHPRRSSALEHLTILSLHRDEPSEIFFRDTARHAMLGLRRLDLRVSHGNGHTLLHPSTFHWSTLTHLELQWRPLLSSLNAVAVPPLPAVRTLTMRIDLSSCIARGYAPQLAQTALNVGATAPRARAAQRHHLQRHPRPLRIEHITPPSPRRSRGRRSMMRRATRHSSRTCSASAAAWNTSCTSAASVRSSHTWRACSSRRRAKRGYWFFEALTGPARD
ncbi:hypothetical protein B0H14DRAFT_2758666, partial [Mycena olivaceomarginata]